MRALTQPLNNLAIAEHLPDPGLVKIREAQQDDIPELRRLYLQLVSDEHPTLSDMEACLTKILADPFNEILVAELDSRPVGTCQIIIYENLIRTPRRKAVIDSVVVDSTVRGHGIGKALVREAVDRLEGKNCCVIGVSTGFHRDVAHDLYAKAGFDRFGYHFIIKP